ncbi:MAG: hypothetical protein GX834_02500 [Clostridiaceae bacterium]|nr:hypothetical protein [Clostridiaceae bacterium]
MEDTAKIFKNTSHSNERRIIKNPNRYIALLIAVALSLVFFAGCSDSTTSEDTDIIAFSYSDGIEDNGFWTGIKAVDHIDMFTYYGLEIPGDVHQISDEDVQEEIDYLLETYTTTKEVTDRAIVDGDTVNIDYVGSVDGIEFSGGSTDGEGAEVVAGSTDYIDDFLIQIIGHTPGETMDIEVTFPDDYDSTGLQGREAVFVTTINYIVETNIPDLNDEFVETNFSDSFGWTTVAEMTAGIQDNYLQYALEEYVMDYMQNEVTIVSIPDTMMDYQVNAMKAYYQSTADDYGVDLDTFLTDYVGVSGMDELIESNEADNANNAVYSLVAQAVAEDAGIFVNDEDLDDFFIANTGSSDYSYYEEELGLPYLMQLTLQQKVIDFIIENAVLL